MFRIYVLEKKRCADKLNPYYPKGRFIHDQSLTRRCNAGIVDVIVLCKHGEGNGQGRKGHWPGDGFKYAQGIEGFVELAWFLDADGNNLSLAQH